MADQTDRDAVAAVDAVLGEAYSRGYADRRHKRDYNPDRAADLALLLAPLLAQARAEAVAAALAPVERLSDGYEWDAAEERYGGELWSTTALALRAAVAEGKEAGRG